MRPFMVVLGIVLFFAGCSTNPEEAGFFGGIANVVSGAYDKQEGELQTELDEAEARRDRLRAKAEALEAEVGSLSPEQEALSRQLASLNTTLADQSSQLDQVRANNDDQAEQLERLRGRERELAEQQLAVDTIGDTAREEIDELQRENEQLAGEIAIFLETLGGS